MDQNHIDGLLERYLYLLHEYTCLREALTALQTGIYQNIARANFSAERGVRFGQDYYDDRMQASRRVVISCKSEEQTQIQKEKRGQSDSQKNGTKLAVTLGGTIPSFTVVDSASADLPALRGVAEDSEANVQVPNPDSNPEVEARAEGVEEESATEPTHALTKTGDRDTSPTSTLDSSSQADVDARSGKEDATPTTTFSKSSSTRSSKKEKTATAQKLRDPLRWFGLLTPMPLRQAQAQGIRAVEHVIPRLASINTEMAEVEIEVRRARKRRAKATVNAPSQRNRQGQEQERGLGVESVAITTKDVRA
jgi:hypothetical protein